MRGQIILWCLITNAVLLITIFFLYKILSNRAVGKQYQEVKEKASDIKLGNTVIFSGGLIGKIKKIEGNEILVDVNGSILRASKFTVMKVIK